MAKIDSCKLAKWRPICTRIRWLDALAVSEVHQTFSISPTQALGSAPKVFHSSGNFEEAQRLFERCCSEEHHTKQPLGILGYSSVTNNPCPADTLQTEESNHLNKWLSLFMLESRWLSTHPRRPIRVCVCTRMELVLMSNMQKSTQWKHCAVLGVLPRAKDLPTQYTTNWFVPDFMEYQWEGHDIPLEV